MKEILGGNLKLFFDSIDKNCDSADITYAGNTYEVWEVSDELFTKMCGMTEEQFAELAGKDAWWRSSDGSVLGIPDTKVHINGKELIGWTGRPCEDDEEDDNFEIYSSCLTNYLCDVIGVSQPKNVCACAMDLAKYNDMTMAELFSEYEGCNK